MIETYLFDRQGPNASAHFQGSLLKANRIFLTRPHWPSMVAHPYSYQLSCSQYSVYRFSEPAISEFAPKLHLESSDEATKPSLWNWSLDGASHCQQEARDVSDTASHASYTLACWARRWLTACQPVIKVTDFMSVQYFSKVCYCRQEGYLDPPSCSIDLFIITLYLINAYWMLLSLLVILKITIVSELGFCYLYLETNLWLSPIWSSMAYSTPPFLVCS